MKERQTTQADLDVLAGMGGLDRFVPGVVESPAGLENLVPSQKALRLLSLEDGSRFRLVGDNVFDLIETRLAEAKENPDDAKIEDKHLFSFGINWLKVAANLQGAEGGGGEQKPGTVVNLVEIVKGLPYERASALMVAAIRQVEDMGGAATAQRQALAQLVAEQGGDPDDVERLLAIEG